MTNAQIPRRKSEELIAREMEDGVLILDQKREKIHQLNQSAAEVWRLCDGQRNREDIASAFAATFSIDTETAAKDVAQVLIDLAELGLVEFETVDEQ